MNFSSSFCNFVQQAVIIINKARNVEAVHYNAYKTIRMIPDMIRKKSAKTCLYLSYITAKTSLVPRHSHPPSERTSGVLNEISRHRHFSALEFQRVQSDCNF